MLRRLSVCAALAVALSPAHVHASSDSPLRDGSHDFDFEIGNWQTHIKRLQHPLTGSATWSEYDGTSVVSKIWGGKANMVELEVDGPAGHIEGLSLRLYNPQSHQWSLNFVSSSGGALGVPTVGEFKNGRGEFYDQEAMGGRMILVRGIWSDITPNSGRFEQASVQAKIGRAGLLAAAICHEQKFGFRGRVFQDRWFGLCHVESRRLPGINTIA